MLKVRLMVATGLVALGLNSVAGNWEYSTDGINSVWEIHVVKNDGMDTHIQYSCNNARECMYAYESIKYRSNNFMTSKNVWIERIDGKFKLIK
jgi:hypothetical protein